MKKLILLSLIAMISSCSNVKIDRTYPDNPENIRKQRAGKFFEGSPIFTTQNNDVPKTNIKKSTPLWIASLEVISGLLPITTADESSGLIITEWHQTNNKIQEDGTINLMEPDRIKINLLVKGKEPVKENLILTMFRQVRNSNGEWIDQKSTIQEALSDSIKDKIIQKANN